MTDGPENLVLEHLLAIRGDMARGADDIRTVKAELKALRHQFAGVITLQEHDHDDIAAIKHRLERVERRLELTD